MTWATHPVVDTYLAAISAGDVEAAVALFADDATLEDPVGTDVVEGIEAIRAFYTRALATTLVTELTGPVRVAGGALAFPFRIGVPARNMTIDAIDVFTLDDEGRVTSMRAYWGRANVSTQ